MKETVRKYKRGSQGSLQPREEKATYENRSAIKQA